MRFSTFAPQMLKWVKSLMNSEKWFSLAALASSLVNPLPGLPLWAMVGGGWKEEEGKLWKLVKQSKKGALKVHTLRLCHGGVIFQNYLK